MEKGLNSDIQVNGRTYHVQTEDWGQDLPFLVTRVYLSGAVVQTLKTPRQEASKSGHSIREFLIRQHDAVLKKLLDDCP